MYGYKIYGAINAEEAMNTLEHTRPDAILMDLRLPGGVDGISLTKTLKQDVNFANIPIIAVTANDIWSKNVRSAGFDGYFQKPVNLQELRSDLKRVTS